MIHSLCLLVEVNQCIIATNRMNQPEYTQSAGIPYQSGPVGGPHMPAPGEFSNLPYPQPGGPPGPGFSQPPPQQQYAAEPSAPPIAQLGFLPPGYEEAGYDRRPIAPPTYYPSADDGRGTNLDAFVLPKIEEQDVMEALKDHVSAKCCWGSGAIDKIKITDIKMSSSYHYHLDTFTEERETAWTFEPFNSVAHAVVPPMGYGGPTPPAPWSIDVRPDQEYHYGEKKLEVPHTQIVRPCHGRCAGTGRMRCNDCNGTGNLNCTWCNGTGMRSEADGSSNRCTQCNGSGRKQCHHCSGSGLKTCNLCRGFGNVRYFIELHVKWHNHEDDFVSDASGLKKKYIEKAVGKVAVQDEGIRVFPFQSFPDPSIANASKQYIDKHTTDYPMERILKQRHSVKVVPVASVHYDYKDDNGIFYVFGDETRRQVYFKEYPTRICYCCSIA